MKMIINDRSKRRTKFLGKRNEEEWTSLILWWAALCNERAHRRNRPSSARGEAGCKQARKNRSPSFLLPCATTRASAAAALRPVAQFFVGDEPPPHQVCPPLLFLSCCANLSIGTLTWAIWLLLTCTPMCCCVRPCSRMALRGVWQLQKLVVNYCDWGGSSRGIRYDMVWLLTSVVVPLDHGVFVLSP